MCPKFLYRIGAQLEIADQLGYADDVAKADQLGAELLLFIDAETNPEKEKLPYKTDYARYMQAVIYGCSLNYHQYEKYKAEQRGESYEETPLDLGDIVAMSKQELWSNYMLCLADKIQSEKDLPRGQKKKIFLRFLGQILSRLAAKLRAFLTKIYSFLRRLNTIFVFRRSSIKG